MKKTEQYYLEEHAIQNRASNVLISFCVRKYDHANLDPYLTIQHKLERTSMIRGTATTKLFISYVKLHKAVSTHTFGRWAKQLFQDNGIDTTILKAQSTRAASVSKAIATVYQQILYYPSTCGLDIRVCV